MKACFMLAALCGMLLVATAMRFDGDEDMDGSQDPSSLDCRGCGWDNNDNIMEEPLTADEIDDMMEMLDAQGYGGRRDRGRGDRGRGDRGRGDRGRGDRRRGYRGRGGYNTDEDIIGEPATTDREMTQDPLLGLGFGWGGWRRPWGGWGRGWGGRGWGWGGRRWGGWGRRYFD